VRTRNVRDGRSWLAPNDSHGPITNYVRTYSHRDGASGLLSLSAACAGHWLTMRLHLVSSKGLTQVRRRRPDGECSLFLLSKDHLGGSPLQIRCTTGRN
jgi:hypothetical protein